MSAYIKNYTVIFVLLFVGIGLGFNSLSNHKLSGDEMLTLDTATGLGHSPLVNNTWVTCPVPIDKKVFTQYDYWARNKFTNVLENTATYNGNMVGYNIILYYFIKLTHVNDGLLRGLSAFFYVISILLVYFIAKILFRCPKIAIISAGLYALNPFVLHMGHDLRSYSFATMTTLLASYLLLKMEQLDFLNFKRKIAWGILLGLIYGVSLLSHYFTAYILIGHAIYAIYKYIVYKKNILFQVFIAFFICSLFFVEWWVNGGKMGFISMGVQDRYILSKTSAQTHTSLISLLVGTICFITSVIGYYFQYLGYRNSSFCYVLILPIALIFFALYKKPIEKEQKKSLVFLTLMIVCCLIFLQLCSIRSGHITSLVMTRFGAFIAPYLMILLGYAFYILLFDKRILLRTISIFILFAHISLNIMCYQIPYGGYWFTYSDVKGNVAKARSEKIPPNPYQITATYIMQHYVHGDTVIYNDWNTSQNVNLYLRDVKIPILQEVKPIQQENYRIINGKS